MGSLSSEQPLQRYRPSFPHRLFLGASVNRPRKGTARQTTRFPPPWRWRVIQTKSRQTLVFHPGGSTGRLRIFHFREGDERSFVRRFSFGRRMVPEPRTEVFVDGGPGPLFSKRSKNSSLRCTYCGRSLSFRSQAGSKKPKYSEGLRLWKLRGCTDVRERHSARSMMARISTERLVASTIWSLEYPLLAAHRHHGVNTTLPNIHEQNLYHAG